MRHPDGRESEGFIVISAGRFRYLYVMHTFAGEVINLLRNRRIRSVCTEVKHTNYLRQEVVCEKKNPIWHVTKHVFDKEIGSKCSS